MLRTTIKGLLAHKLRLGLTALAIVLGVSFISGTYVLTDTINATFDKLFADVSTGVDVYVRSETAFTGGEDGGDREPLPEKLLETVAAVPGVAEAEGSVVGYAQLVDKEGEAITPIGPPTLGVSWSPGRMSALTVRDGRPPESSNEVAIDAATAEKYDFQVGDRVKVLLAGPAREFTVVGIAGFGEADNLAGATLAAFDLKTAQEVLERKNGFDAIEVAAGDGVTATELRDRIAAVLPNRVEATTATAVAEEQAQTIQKELGFLSTALLVFAGVALFVGAFLIFNTFSIIVAQRAREFALLRALGASRAQVMSSVMLEALIVSLVASAIGLGAGVLLASGLKAILSGFGVDLPSTDLQFLPRTAIVSVAVGILVTVVAALVPARKGAQVSPVEALRESATEAYRPSRRRGVVGMVIVALGAATLAVGLFRDISRALEVVGAGALIVFIGVTTLSPLFAGKLAQVLGRPLARMFKVPGKLAGENAARNPKRTAATSAALMIGLALVSLTSIFAASLKASANRILDESLKADFVVANSAMGEVSNFSPEVARLVSRRAEVAAASPIRYGQWRSGGKIEYIAAIDPATFGQVASIGDVSGGSVEALGDGVLVHEAAAAERGLGPGDTIEAEFAATGKVDLEVVGIFSDDNLVPSYLISLDTFDDNFTRKLDSIVFVKAAPGVTPESARAAVAEATEPFPNVEVQDQTEFKEQQSQQIDTMLGLITALLGLALIIALLGITNTLALSVFERTREIGLLRAVGMLRRQARSMIRWESMIIAVIGALLGLVVGSFFGWALVRALAEDGITELVIPSSQLLIYVALAAVAGIVAGLPPARRAARLNVLEAISYE